MKNTLTHTPVILPLQYMETAAALPMFGYVHFQPCVCDYPNSNTPAQIAVGRRELLMKVRAAGSAAGGGELKEGSFKVGRHAVLKQSLQFPSVSCNITVCVCMLKKFSS